MVTQRTSILPLVLMTVLFGLLLSQAMAKWVSKSPLPTRRSDMSCHHHNGLVYVTGGCASAQVYESNYSACDTLSKRLDIYNQETDVWTIGADMPRVRNRHTGVAHEGFVYLFGGRDQDDAIITQVDVYNIAGDNWATLPVTFTHAASDMAAYVQDGKVVLLGGYDSNYASLNKTHVFNPVSKTFQYNIAEMPQSRGDLCAVAILNEGFIYGGFNDADFCDPLDTMDKFRLSSKTYTHISENSSGPDGGDAGCAVVNNIFYVVGGESKVDIDGICYSDPLDTAQSFDPTTGKWKLEPSMTLVEPRFRQCTVNVNGRIHLMGGQGPLTLVNGELIHYILDDNKMFVPDSGAASLAPFSLAGVALAMVAFLAARM